jgi:hypothetical protein
MHLTCEICRDSYWEVNPELPYSICSERCMIRKIVREEIQHAIFSMLLSDDRKKEGDKN